MNRLLRSVWAEIDLDAIKYNIKNIKKKVFDKKIITVVKADGYGHGALEISKVLLENGASILAVATFGEAMKLRENGIVCPIIILGYTPLTAGYWLIENNIEQTVYDYDYAYKLSKIAENLGKKAKIHIAVDTGMGRIGYFPDENSVNEIKKIKSLKGIEITGIFTHFSTSDEKDKTYTKMQLEKYNNFIKMLEKNDIHIPLKHAANSAAIMEMPETFKNLDAVRAGIILYGYYPSDEVDKNTLSIKKALTLKCSITHVKKIEKGMSVSYGRKFISTRKTKIVTLPIGYDDGYTRLLSGKAKVIINGKFAPVVGNICMDQCMVDVTDLGEVQVNDEVILLGESGNLKYDADDMASDIGSINYEIICMLKERIPRVYFQDNKIVKVVNY
ncbi:alanine racemase [Clostridium sp. BJN0001]|uniref:alanine racemase n=1 Tax=Clostridium sp. BJN0001 TaxID=2930219 RepID=UPI001FD5876F|nr:alanine racemase [Clostridium sp. BJN0001]